MEQLKGNQQVQEKQNQNKQIFNKQLQSSHEINQKIEESNQQIPDHFYDSDIASVNEKDFQSDNQPPKDIIQQRKRLYKEKFLHVFKTILKIGKSIQRPARWDKITLKYKSIPSTEMKFSKEKKNSNQKIEQCPVYFHSEYLETVDKEIYNIGHKNQHIQRLVTSMKRGETALYQLEYLQTSKKSNIKIKNKTQMYLISVETWITVLSIDENNQILKSIQRKGQGNSRVSKYDEVALNYTIRKSSTIVEHVKYQESIRLEEQIISKISRVVWDIICSMKDKQISETILTEANFKKREESGKFDQFMQKMPQQIRKTDQKWTIQIEIISLIKIDDVLMDGRLLKKTLVKGVSSARADSNSLVYYSLKFMDINGFPLKEDACFSSDWWQDFTKLQKLGCRKNYLDEFAVSKMLKQAIKRIKPAEIAAIECRDPSLFQYGIDYQQMKQLLEFKVTPNPIHLIVRVYNFTEGKNAFNMQISQKVNESHRIKKIAINLLKNNNYSKALKKFRKIVAFFSSGDIIQQTYDEKVSALMNCILCHLKMENYIQMLQLCNQVLEKPKHGYNIKNMKIKGSGKVKVQGQYQACLNNDTREDAKMDQSQLILDKCLYRKALALSKTGQNAQALLCLSQIVEPNNEVQQLRSQAEKGLETYKLKSKKLYKNMFQ